MKAKVIIYDDYGRQFAVTESIEFPFTTLIDSEETNKTRSVAITAIESAAIETIRQAIAKATLEPAPEPPEPPDPNVRDIFGMG